jgi:hypothetical protein
VGLGWQTVGLNTVHDATFRIKGKKTMKRFIRLSEDVMGPRPATMHESSLFGTKSFISNRGSGYFHGSEGSAFCLFSLRNSRCFAALSMTDPFFSILLD